MINAHSPLAPEIDYVLQSPTSATSWRYVALIDTPSGPIDSLKVMSIDTLENYATAYAPFTTVEILMGLGAYSKRVLPGRENLTITIVRYNVLDRNENEFMLYNAKLLDKTTPALDDPGYQSIAEKTLDLAQVVVVSFQLMDRVTDELKRVRIGTVFREVSARGILESALTFAIEQVELDAEYMPTGVEVYGEANETVYPQVIIPDMTDLCDLPGYLQKKQMGIYPTDIGHFFKDNTWFVYPLYDTTRFNDGNDTLMITMVPANMMVGVKHTFRTNGNTTMILCSGDREVLETGESELVSEGEGVRFADADRLMGDWFNTDLEENKAIAARARNVSEFVMEGEADKPSLNAKMAANPITTNKFKELSKLAPRKGSYYRCEWLHADPSILKPGMMARVRYMEDDVVRWFEGPLVTAAIQTRLLGKGITSNTFGTTVNMVFFVNRDLDLEGDGSEVTDFDLF